MKRHILFALAGLAALGCASHAGAADLIIEEPASAGVVDVSGNWDGAYLGAFVGYGSGSPNLTGDTDDLFDIEGLLVGATLGADFAVTDGVVAGVVGDIAWSNISDDVFEDFTVDWVGSVRGRLGLDAGAFLPYLTAGLAVAGAGLDDDSNTFFGWTAGAGVEFAISDSLSADLLYRYSDYGPAELLGADYDFQTHQVTLGLNWRF